MTIHVTIPELRREEKNALKRAQVAMINRRILSVGLADVIRTDLEGESLLHAKSRMAELRALCAAEKRAWREHSRLEDSRRRAEREAREARKKRVRGKHA